jgi:hypothetical protein
MVNLFIEGKKIEIQGESVGFSAKYTDAFALSNNGGSFSQDLFAPATPNNLEVFKQSNLVDGDNFYLNNRNTEAILDVDGLHQIRGQVSLENSLNSFEGVSGFNITFISGIGHWAVGLREISLRDLEWADIRRDVASIPASAGYDGSFEETCFPLIDYGKWVNGVTPTRDDYYPAIFIRQAIQKAFSSIGYTIAGAFASSDIFNRLIIPFNGEALKDLTFDDAFEANTGADESFTTVDDSDERRVITDNEISDISGVHTNGVIVPVGGSRGRITVDFVVGDFANGFSPDGIGSQYVVIELKLINFTSSEVISSVEIQWRKDDSDGEEFFYVNDVENVSFDPLEPITVSFTTDEFIYPEGDGLEVAWNFLEIADGFNPLNGIYSGDFTLFAETTTSSEIVRGSGVLAMANNVPDIKVIDVLRDLTKMFNLKFATDTNLKEVTFEPRDDFYSGSIDWSSKLDKSKDIEITHIANHFPESINFAMKDDGNDAILKHFKDTGEEIANSEQVITVGGFDQNSYDVNLGVFAPTYMREKNGRELPTMWKELLNGVQPDKQTKYAPRILTFHGGDTYNRATSYPIATGTNLTFRNLANGRGLVQEYYASTIQEKKVGKVAKLQMAFSAADLFDFKPSSIVHIFGTDYIINSISGADLTKPVSLCDVEATRYILAEKDSAGGEALVISPLTAFSAGVTSSDGGATIYNNRGEAVSFNSGGEYYTEDEVDALDQGLQDQIDAVEGDITVDVTFGAASSWTHTHNKGKRLSLMLYDNSGNIIDSCITNNTTSSFTVTHSAPISGRVIGN